MFNKKSIIWNANLAEKRVPTPGEYMYRKIRPKSGANCRDFVPIFPGVDTSRIPCPLSVHHFQYKINHFKYKTQKSSIPVMFASLKSWFKCEIHDLNTKFMILNTKFMILNTKFMILNAKFMILNTKFMIWMQIATSYVLALADLITLHLAGKPIEGANPRQPKGHTWRQQTNANYLEDSKRVLS